MVANKCRVLRLCVANGSNQTEWTNLLHILCRTHFIIEQLTRYNQYQRNKNTQQQRGSVVITLGLRIDRTQRTRFIQNGVIRRVTCFLNLRFRTLLQEERVVVIIDTIITLNSNHLQLFRRQFLYFALHFGVTVVQVFLLYLQGRAHRLHNLVNHGLDVLDILGIFSIINVLLRQFATLNTQVIQLLHKGYQCRIVQAKRRRSYHCAAFHIRLQVLGEIIEIRLAQTHRHHLLVVGRNLTHQLTGVGTDIHEFILLSKVSHRAFGNLQRLLKRLQLFVDEAY